MFTVLQNFLCDVSTSTMTAAYLKLCTNSQWNSCCKAIGNFTFAHSLPNVWWVVYLFALACSNCMSLLSTIHAFSKRICARKYKPWKVKKGCTFSEHVISNGWVWSNSKLTVHRRSEMFIVHEDDCFKQRWHKHIISAIDCIEDFCICIVVQHTNRSIIKFMYSIV